MNIKFCRNNIVKSLGIEFSILRTGTKFDVLKIENGAISGPYSLGITF